ncbi:MAG: MOSC domain-containing protein [Candidatus Pristimantibacillus sp.]
MHPIPIGQMMDITRYPVKSMAGEKVSQTYIASYGIYGDRSHAFVDNTKVGWDRYITARQIPQMLGYKAKFAETIDERIEGNFPAIEVVSPDGEMFTWNDQLLQQIQPLSKQKISMIRCEPNSEELLAVDAGAVLIITDRTYNKLEHILNTEIDKRRFRPNLIIRLHEESIQDERELIGKRISVGGAELEIKEECERCSMITIHPETLERDVTILKAVNAEMNLKFGLYASVVRPGEVKTGETVYLSVESVL